MSTKSKLREKFPMSTSADAFTGGETALSDSGFDLLSRMLAHDPKRRISAEDALAHPWFHVKPLAVDQSELPVFEAGARE